MFVLDVGCGRDPRGDVNIDIYRPAEMNPHTEKPPIRYVPNFILADAHYLPFRAKVFDRVLCYEVLEHLRNPWKALKEMVRVCREEVEITTPHRCKPKINPTHRQHFSVLNIFSADA